MIGRSLQHVFRDRPRPVPRLLLLFVLPLLLAACSRVDPAMRDACVATLPALEEGTGPIVVLAVDRLGDHAVRLRYRSDPGSGAHVHEIACAFAPGDRGPELVGIRTEQGPLPLARFFVLQRFWLGEPGLAAAGLARVDFAPDLR